MGVFDRMFGSGAAAAQAQPNAQRRFDELKLKYQSVLNSIELKHVQLDNLHVQDNKLFIKGTARSMDDMDQIWNEIKLIDPNYEKDLTCDIEGGAGGSW